MITRLLRVSSYKWIGSFLVLALIGCGGQSPVDSSGEDHTVDVTPPRVAATFPTDGQTAVPVDIDILVTFSERLAIRIVRDIDSQVTVYQAIGGRLEAIPRTLEWDALSFTLRIKPHTNLAPDTHYTVKIGNKMADAAGNLLETTSPDQTVTWRFTTGNFFDTEPPAWNAASTARAVADRYDAITVCWWNDDPPQGIADCNSAVDSLPPAAYDLPSGASNGLIYIVEYKRSVEASFSSVSTGLVPGTAGAHRLTLTGLVADTDYEIRLKVSDAASNQATETVPIEPRIVKTPPAGRLYAANFGSHSIAAVSDIAQASGDKASILVTADQTGLVAPTGIAVDPVAGYVYIADTTANSISAYPLQTTINGTVAQFGQYGVAHNIKPAWTIRGDRSRTDLTQLCGPATLRLERRPDKTYLYVANSLVMATGYGSGLCVPDNILVFDVTLPPQGSNQAPYATIRNPDFLRSPLAYAVDEVHGLVYVANRDNSTVTDNAGGIVSVFSFTRNPINQTIQLGPAPLRFFWGTSGGPCTSADAAVRSRICGPSAAAYDSVNDTLIIVNRGKNNLLVFPNASSAEGTQSPAVVEGPDTGLDNGKPVGIFFDDATRRVYVTTDRNQSVLIFDADSLFAGGNVMPLRVIKGTKTMLGQPAKALTDQSSGPFAVAVVPQTMEAFVATPGIIGGATIPSVSVFDVSAARDPAVVATDPFSARVTNTAPARVLVNPLQGASGVAIDLVSRRLYVASFHANMILVYDDPLDFASGRTDPDRIIAGPRTQLDHPVAVHFRRDAASGPGELYVVNQSSHAITVFTEGDGTTTPLLGGDVAPTRYIGPPDGTDPFASSNATELVFPTGMAIDPDHDILYVSNRDAESFQDLVGRRIVAFMNAGSVGPYNPLAGVTTANNIAPTWKIQGDPPPNPSTTGTLQPTDKTTLKRPAGLTLIPDSDPSAANDRLVVANRDGRSVLIFQGVSQQVLAAQASPPGPSVNRAPTWTLTHASLFSPFGLAFNAGIGELYVSDTTGRILAFGLGSLKLDTPAPALTPRVVQGSSTGFLGPLGLALDPQN